MSERAKSTKSLKVTHDTFFIETFQMERFAKSFLKVVLPKKTVRLLDLEAITIIPRHVTNDLFKGKIADVIYRVPIRKSKQHIDFFAVLEHKSQSDFLTIFQLWSYVQRICEQNLREAKVVEGFNPRTYRLPPVIPVIIHHGTSAFTGKTQLSELFVRLPEIEKYLPTMEAVLFDLSRLDDSEIPSDPDVPELKAVLTILKAVFRRDYGTKLQEIIELLKPLSEVPEYRRLIRLIWLYSVYNAKFLKRDYELVFPAVQEATGDKDMKTMVEIWMAEGEAKGIAEGEVRGELKGQIEAILAILGDKFRKVPASIGESLNKRTDLTAMKSLVVLAATCKSLDEFAKALK